MMLVVASHHTAQARGADPAVERMVICTGVAAVVVYVDASGTPTYAPHQCPDCALHTLDGLPLVDFGLVGVPVLSHHTAGDAPLAQPAQPHLRATARAPPILI